MDWSLVLLSQGIESTIDYAEDNEAGWGLFVTELDRERALASICQYQLENRRWPWRQEMFKPGLLFDWASLLWVVLAGLFFWRQRVADLQSAGMMDSFAVAHGQWWRLFTAMWLHADLPHLATNAGIGLVLLGLAMAAYGTGAGLLAAYLAGAGGNVMAGLLAPEPHRSLGASGMVMGSLGLLAVQSFTLWRKTPHASRARLAGISGGVLLFILLGLTPGTDILAHAGGFCSGVLIGGLLSLVPNLAHERKANLLCALLFAWLVVFPWWQAWKHSG